MEYVSLKGTSREKPAVCKYALPPRQAAVQAQLAAKGCRDRAKSCTRCLQRPKSSPAAGRVCLRQLCAQLGGHLAALSMCLPCWCRYTGNKFYSDDWMHAH